MPREAGATAELWVGRAEQLVAASVAVAWVAAARAAAAKAAAAAGELEEERAAGDLVQG